MSLHRANSVDNATTPVLDGPHTAIVLAGHHPDKGTKPAYLVPAARVGCEVREDQPAQTLAARVQNGFSAERAQIVLELVYESARTSWALSA